MISVEAVGPEVPAVLAPLLLSIRDAINELQNPKEPTPLYRSLQAALPPASEWTGCHLIVIDLNIIAHSDGVNWIREDTGAPV